MVGSFMYFWLWFPLNVLRVTRLWRWKIIGLENLLPEGKGCVMTPNHLHWTDVHVVGSSVPWSHRPWWLGKSELFNKPLAAWWLTQQHVVPVRRGRGDSAALDAAEQGVRDGAVLVVFPEGHRSDTGQLMEGRGGAVRIAVRAGVPIIPMAVWGTEAGMIGAIQRRPITVVYGAPYYPKTNGDQVTIPAEEMDALTDEMMLKVAALLPEKYHGVYREKLVAAQSVQLADRH